MAEHVIPKTLLEALELLEQSPYTILAGGTDVLVKARRWAGTKRTFAHPAMFLREIESLHTIQSDSHILEIGACVSLSTIAKHPLTPALLKETITEIASPAIRNMATLGGNIANASPAADGVLALCALQAKVFIQSAQKTRLIAVEEIALGPGKTHLAANELITAIHIPLLVDDFHAFYKVGTRRADAISKVALAGFAQFHHHKVSEWRLYFGAVGKTILWDHELDFSMLGKTKEMIYDEMEDIISKYAQVPTPIDDQRSTKQYRQLVARNLVKKFIRECLGEVDG